MIAFRKSALASAVAAALCTSPSILAQQLNGTAVNVGTGVISGQILDPATGEYLRNAIIRLNGRQVTTSAERGEFRIPGVPPGTAELSVEFTGYTTEIMTVNVAAGGNVLQDIALRSSLTENNDALDEVVISGVREGDAKAIMEQRASMNIVNTLSADSFGEIGDGNPAEFLKYMPGVDFDVVADDVPRNISLRGLPARYTGVTLNGVSLAGGVDANAADSRQFSFEQSVLTGIDSISVSKTTSADMDANAPAGTIDIRTRKAFDRRGRSITVQLGTTTHKALWDEYQAGWMEGGYDRKFFPTAQVNYADVFLEDRLGVTVGLSKTTNLIEQAQITAGRNYVPTASSPEAYAIPTIAGAYYNREYGRESASLGLDFRATNNLILSLMAATTVGDIDPSVYTPTFTTNARTRGVVGGGDPALDFSTNSLPTSATLDQNHTFNYKIGHTQHVVPSFEWDNGSFRLDGNLIWSASDSSYDPTRKGQVYDILNTVTARGNFSAVRSNLIDQDWKIQQLDGADWSDPASYTLGSVAVAGGNTTRPVVRTHLGTSAESDVKGASLNFSVDRQVGRVPVTWKTGAKLSQTGYEFDNDSEAFNYVYDGPLTNAAFLAAIQSANEVNFANSGMRVRTLNGGGLYVPSLAMIHDMMQANPAEWTNSLTPANWYNANVANARAYDEDVTSAYFMGTADLSTQLRAQAGLRLEHTKGTSQDFDPLTPEQVAAAGFAVSATTGRATTIEGLEYQYFTNDRLKRAGKYTDLFPSASLKYAITESFDLIAGYSRTIQRPNVSVLAGVWSVALDAEDGTVVTAPNPNLEPEYSDNFSVRAVKYFEPVGLIGFNYYRNKIKNGIVSQNLTAEEFGYTGTEYADAIFSSFTNRSDEATDIDGYEFEFNHAMDYLPGALRGLTVRGSYLLSDPDMVQERVATRVAQFGLGWNGGAARLNLNGVWSNEKDRGQTGAIAVPDPDGPGTINITQSQPFKPYWEVNVSGSYTFITRSADNFMGLEAYFSANNIFDNHRGTWYSNQDAGLAQSGHHSQIDIYSGQKATLGIRARF